MDEEPNIPLLDHELAADELAWAADVYEDFKQLQAVADPKEKLREVLGRAVHRLPTPLNLAGPGPWTGGRNRHGRLVAAVFLPGVELHRHARSRTDQFPMYVVGEADGFSIGADGQPVLTPVTGGDHFHNAPNAAHAFLPKVGKPIHVDWGIAFVAITPRNLREDTLSVSDDVRAAYRRVVGMEAPLDA